MLAGGGLGADAGFEELAYESVHAQAPPLGELGKPSVKVGWATKLELAGERLLGVTSGSQNSYLDR